MSRPRYLIAGAGGMLGTALRKVFCGRGIPFEAPPESDFDITDPRSVRSVMDAFVERGTLARRADRIGEEQGPEAHDIVVNAAAYTNVEGAEDDPEAAFRANEHGARVLAEAVRDMDLVFVHVSTDFVFDGTKDGPYTEDDEPAPLSVYGASKLAGERAVAEVYPEAIIVRTAWVYGPPTGGFPGKIIAAARERDELQVVVDEVGSPTYAVDLAGGIVGLVEAGAQGLYHLAGAGACNRLELAGDTLTLAGLDTPVTPVRSGEFPTKARRPANSVLDCSRAASLGVTMRPWSVALARYVEEEVLGD